jgi:hypothetical protein
MIDSSIAARDVAKSSRSPFANPDALKRRCAQALGLRERRGLRKGNRLVWLCKQGVAGSIPVRSMSSIQFSPRTQVTMCCPSRRFTDGSFCLYP